MYKQFIGTCLMGVALSLKIESGIDLENLIPENGFTPAEEPTFTFAQQKKTISSKVCQKVPDRNKANLPDFYGILNGGDAFTDDAFPHTSNDVFAFSDADETYRYHIPAKESWMRAKDVFTKEKGYSLFGKNGVTPQDMRQGAIGNCWFISAASALSEKAGRLEKVFLNDDISDNGIYAVQLYTLGIPHTVIVDDYLPLEKWGDEYHTMYAKPGGDKSIYGPILEKAFAKYHGNYEHIIGGNPGTAVKTLYGAPWSQFEHKNVDVDTLWNALKASDENDDVIQCGTNGSNHFRQGTEGLALGHAYTVIGVKEL